MGVLSYEIVPGNYCNLACKHCYAKDNERIILEREKILTKKQIEKVIQFIKVRNIRKLDICGGEPLLSKNLVFVIKEFKKNITGGFAGIVTNGTMLDENKVKRLEEAGIDSYSISLESINERKHDYIRGKGCFRRTMMGIKNLRKHTQSFTISFTIMKHNIGEIENLPEFAHSVGANGVALQTVEYWGNAKKYWAKIGIDDITISYCAIMKMHKLRPSIYMNVLGPLRLRSFLNLFFNANLEIGDNSCKAGIENFLLNSSGELAPCPAYMYKLLNETINIRDFPLQTVIRFVDRQYRNFNLRIKSKALHRFSTCISCPFRTKCTPCPEGRSSKKIEECEWLRKLESNVLKDIIKSGLKLSTKYVTDGSKIYFELKGQKEPIIIPMPEKEFMKLLRLPVSSYLRENKVDYPKKLEGGINLKDPFRSFIQFLCKLRSYDIITISNFWDSIEKEYSKRAQEEGIDMKIPDTEIPQQFQINNEHFA